MRKIELRELERMLADVTTPDRILRRYLIPAEHEGSALRPRLAPNPDLVIGGGV